jgi:hypothetical protein
LVLLEDLITKKLDLLFACIDWFWDNTITKDQNHAILATLYHHNNSKVICHVLKLFQKFILKHDLLLEEVFHPSRPLVVADGMIGITTWTFFTVEMNYNTLVPSRASVGFCWSTPSRKQGSGLP